MKKIWVIGYISTGLFTMPSRPFQHNSYAAALLEAEGRAKRHPDHTYVILTTVSTTKAIKIEPDVKTEEVFAN